MAKRPGTGSPYPNPNYDPKGLKHSRNDPMVSRQVHRSVLGPPIVTQEGPAQRQSTRDAIDHLLPGRSREGDIKLTTPAATKKRLGIRS